MREFLTCSYMWIIADCDPNPCTHGVCKSSLRGYSCTCHQGYHGSICDKSKFEIYFTDMNKKSLCANKVQVHDYICVYVSSFYFFIQCNVWWLEDDAEFNYFTATMKKDSHLAYLEIIKTKINTITLHIYSTFYFYCENNRIYIVVENCSKQI